MSSQNAAADPFDTGFDAEDDFTSQIGLETEAGQPLVDPFADLPPSRPHAALAVVRPVRRSTRTSRRPARASARARR